MTSRLRPWLFVAALLLGLTALGGAAPPAPATADNPAVPGDAASALDEPLRLVAEARSGYAKITDYTCTLIKKERINGELTPENVVAMGVRCDPFSVDLRWLQPKAQAGQEACYVAGKNDGKMRVRSSGLLGVAGFLSVDPADPRCQKTSRHAITEAGIGNLIERLGARWELERKLNLTQVHIGEYEYNKRRCVRVETLHAANPDHQFNYCRTVVYFDKESRLPIRLEGYDWPHGADDPGALMEMASYANLHLNVGLGDETFDH